MFAVTAATIATATVRPAQPAAFDPAPAFTTTSLAVALASSQPFTTAAAGPAVATTEPAAVVATRAAAACVAAFQRSHPMFQHLPRPEQRLVPGWRS